MQSLLKIIAASQAILFNKTVLPEPAEPFIK
jgi:hypothetical protein